MRINYTAKEIKYCEEVEREDLIRDWEPEDLEHIEDAILTIQERTNALDLPGLESIHKQISLRLKEGAMLDD